MSASREAIWLALSDLWLDVEPDVTSRLHIIRVLRASGLPLAELERIFYEEVAPVVWLNGWSVAGVWTGFDAQWLAEACRRNQARGRWHRLRCRLLRWPMTAKCIEEWRLIVAELTKT
ncbi:DUF7079 family protein [Pseudomonas sp. BMS12]|uniref:DUF7079 family protein n=1 Tax=Pseudomonas sp. BMS12 TaxID=1796033 RepID=UPI00083B8B6A|nr:hypothetical protein [Pseudomonas sp. BMS12]